MFRQEKNTVCWTACASEFGEVKAALFLFLPMHPLGHPDINFSCHENQYLLYQSIPENDYLILNTISLAAL